MALIDDHELFRAGLRSLLEQYPEFVVVGEAGTARLGYEMCERTRPDVVLLDVRLRGTDGISAARELKRRLPETRVAILSAFEDADFVSDALQAGANGYLLKSEAVVECIEGIRAIAHGRTFLASAISPAALEQHRRLQRDPERGSGFQLLSNREKEVFHLLVRGLSNSKVARELCISVKTVESHREHILRKLGLHSIVELVRFAARNGYLPEERKP